MYLVDTTYAADPSSIPTARDDVSSALPETIDPAARGDLLIAVSEAVTNVVRHSGADTFRVTVDNRDRAVEVTVTDSGAGIDGAPAEMPDPTAFGGRGLPLMEALVDQCRISSSEAGTTVWLRKEIEP